MNEIAHALNTTADDSLIYDVVTDIHPTDNDDVSFDEYEEVLDFLDVFVSEVNRG